VSFWVGRWCCICLACPVAVTLAKKQIIRWFYEEYTASDVSYSSCCKGVFALFMNNEVSCVCPIFVLHNKNNELEQIGSGVLLKIKEKGFLLTAAHVSDWSKEGNLCIPTMNGIEEISGYWTSILAPKGLGRAKDKIDISYYLLDDDLKNNIHQDFNFLRRNECWLTDNLCEGDIYTFTGFPLTKAKRINRNEFSSELFSYTGEAAIQKKYENLEFEKDTNIIVNFCIKKAVDPMSGRKMMPPHPKGISGGAIFRWPKNIEEKIEKIGRSLVGIGHTYIKKHQCLIGTKLSLYFQLIANNHPELFDNKTAQNDNGIPLFLALVCYKKEEWSMLLSQFDDAENMQNSWAEWRNAAEYGIEHMDRNGKLIIPIELSASEISEFCKLKNLPNTGRTRADLANHKLIEMLKESKVVQI